MWGQSAPADRFNMESDDWQVVSKKKAFKKSSGPKEKTTCRYSGPEQSENLYTMKECTDAIKRINDAIGDLKMAQFWDSAQDYLLRSQDTSPVTSSDSNINEELMKNLNLEESKPTSVSLQQYECVCYGLGNFTTCIISRNQLAFLLLVLDLFKIPRHQCHVFDPVFSQFEIEVLQQLGLSVLLENQEGKHAVCKPTVFYMPHCGKALYNNVLWRNWSCDALSQMIIIGNSFKGIEERLVSRILQRDYIYIYMSLPVIEEVPFPDSEDYSNVFNDISFHRFPIEKLKSLPGKTWQTQDEPQYEHCEDLEIILRPKK